MIFRFKMMVLTGAFLSFAWAQDSARPEPLQRLDRTKKVVSKKIDAIEENLNILQLALGKAKKLSNNFSMINCLLIKKDLNEGLLEAAQRSKITIEGLQLEGKKEEADAQIKRFEDLLKSSEELRDSIPDCVSDPKFLADLGLVFEDAALDYPGIERDLEDFGWQSLPGVETLPPALPASPFR